MPWYVMSGDVAMAEVVASVEFEAENDEEAARIGRDIANGKDDRCDDMEMKIGRGHQGIDWETPRAAPEATPTTGETT